jgi:hypothetical protein
MTKYDNELYVGGSFYINLVGGGQALCLAKWNGMKWDTIPIQPFDDTFNNGFIWTLASLNNNLFIGGIFDIVDGIPVSNIAKWNGSIWSSVGFKAGYNYGIDAITEYNGEIYIGGSFSDTLGNTMNIARWDGVNWKSVGGGFHGGTDEVSSMVVYKNELYVAGSFTVAHGNPGNYIAKWNGTNWTDVGGGVMGLYGSNGQIFEIKVHNNELYVVGGFSFAGGVPAQFIAKWNVTEWCGLGGYFDNGLESLVFFKDTLYVGGGAWTVDGDTINHIAKWTGGSYVDTCGSITGINPIGNQEILIHIYPNPATNTLYIDGLTGINTAEVYDISGKLLLSEHDKTNQINIRSLAKGLYFIKLTTEEGSVVRKFVKE